MVLFYTDPGSTATHEAASFKMGDMTGRWARFTITVQGAQVSLGLFGARLYCIKEKTASLEFVFSHICWLESVYFGKTDRNSDVEAEYC